MICLTATFYIQEGRESEAEDLFRRLAEGSRQEPGCLMYLVHRSPANPRQFFVYEQFKDQAAIEAHNASPHFRQYVEGGLDRVQERREVARYEPIL